MRPAVQELMTTLLERSRLHGAIDIDDLGDAVTPLGMSPAEIEELMDELERRGVIVRAPTDEPGENTKRLQVVLASARTLTSVLGRRPTIVEIAEHSKLDVIRVRHALAVGRIMGRG